MVRRKWRAINKVPTHVIVVVLQTRLPDTSYRDIGNIDTEWMQRGTREPLKLKTGRMSSPLALSLFLPKHVAVSLQQWRPVFEREPRESGVRQPAC